MQNVKIAVVALAIGVAVAFAAAGTVKTDAHSGGAIQDGKFLYLVK